MLKKIIQFIVYSSKDPNKISLTLKGAAGVVASIIVTAVAVLGLGTLPVNQVTNILKEIVDIVMTIIGVISAIITVYGAVRKLVLTAIGENKAI